MGPTDWTRGKLNNVNNDDNIIDYDHNDSDNEFWSQ